MYFGYITDLQKQRKQLSGILDEKASHFPGGRKKNIRLFYSNSHCPDIIR